MRSVVVVMAAFNAENTLSPVVRGLRKSLPGAYVIGINDGSADGTGALADEILKEGAVCVADTCRLFDRGIDPFVDEPKSR